MKIRNIFIYGTVVFAFCTFITEKIFGFNEKFAEGLPLIFGFTYFWIVLEKRISIKALPLTIYLIILLFFTQIAIIKNNGSFYQFIFIYSYLPAYLLYHYSKKIIIDAELIFKIVSVTCVISALFGILQFLQLQNFIPIDINRARGLSRSTLNYSTLLFLGYIAVDFTNYKLKNFFKIIILIGIIFSLSRSALLSIIVYEFIKNINSFRFYIKNAIFFILLLVLIQAYDFKNIEEISNRFYSGFNFKSDESNVQRLYSYQTIIEEFSLFGQGLGSTGPAAARFNKSASGFESFLLALIYQGGIAFFFLMPFIILCAKLLLIPLTLRKCAVIASYIAMMAGHQTFETPAVNMIGWLVILTILNHDKIKKLEK